MLDAVQAEAGPIDILVNSAGAAGARPSTNCSHRRWHDAMQAKFFTYVT